VFFLVSNQGVPFASCFIGPDGSGQFWCFSIKKQNFRFDPKISGPKQGVPFPLVFIVPTHPKSFQIHSFGAENSRVDPKILGSETGGAVYLGFYGPNAAKIISGRERKTLKRS
jgi:hypothetical protein